MINLFEKGFERKWKKLAVNYFYDSNMILKVFILISLVF